MDIKKEAQPTHFSKLSPESPPYDEARGNLAAVGRPSDFNVAEDDSKVNNNDEKYSLITDNPKAFIGLTFLEWQSKLSI